MTTHSQTALIRKATVERFGATQVLKVAWEDQLQFEVPPLSSWQSFEEPKVDFEQIGRGVEPGYVIRATWEGQALKPCGRMGCVRDRGDDCDCDEWHKAHPLFPAIILWWLFSWGKNF